jgi:ribosomal protein S26
MAKIIAWLIVIFVVLLALRLVNVRNARRQRERAPDAEAQRRSSSEPMVRCVRCGIYLPRDEARKVTGGYACVAGECASHA